MKNSKPNNNSEPEITESISDKDAAVKKPKNTKKLIIIISAAVLVICAILVLINPGCLFYHRKSSYYTDATCLHPSYRIVKCNVCEKEFSREEQPGGRSDHEYSKIVCGKEIKCLECGEKTIFQHDFFGSNYCVNCDEYAYPITLPSAPITSSKYGTDGEVKESIVITEIYTKKSSYNLEIRFSAKRTFHQSGESHSAPAEFAWKLYAPDGTVVDSGIATSNGSVSVGENTVGYITVNLPLLTKFTEYRFEIFDIK